MSPRKKKRRIAAATVPKPEKREPNSQNSPNKRAKSIKNPDEELQARKRKNFVTACEQVSYRAYFDHRTRLLLLYLPPCMKTTICTHQDSNSMNIKEMLPSAEEVFMIDARANMWNEALEVCVMCTTPTQYLSANVLREVVEIMLNAHEDDSAENSVTYVIENCQQVLINNFNIHPPCFMKRLRKCYNDFLFLPMDLKQKTFTNRAEYGCDKGIVKYVFNRLEYELSADSKNEPLFDKCENIPEELKQSVKGIHWAKEKLEIFELLNRNDRIDRLMLVLETVIELLQFDLAIWHGRYTSNLGNHIMRSHKPLMAFILWSNNIICTGAVNNMCRQILRVFVNIVHLQYPERYINVMTLWVNVMIQTFYICEANSNSDYPNTGKYCFKFATEFYKIFEAFPHDSIIRILENIKPTFMKHLVGVLYIKRLLSTEESCIISILTDFINTSKWDDYPDPGEPIETSKNTFLKPVNVKRLMRQLIKKCENLHLLCVPNEDEKLYPKLDNKNLKLDDFDLNRNHVVYALYITLESYLETYSVQNVQETLDNLNEKLTADPEGSTSDFLPETDSYSVTEEFIKKYRSIYEKLKQLVPLLQERKTQGTIPESFDIFKNIGLCDL